MRKNRRASGMVVLENLEPGVPAWQGELMVERVECIPPAKLKESVDNVVAHSETGHHHVAVGAKVFDQDEFVSYMVSTGAVVDIEHHREVDRHDTLRLPSKVGDVFKITRQREGSNDVWRKVID